MEEVVNAWHRNAQGKKMLTLVGIYICVVFSIYQSTGVSIILPVAAAEFDALSGTNEAMTLYSLTGSLAGPVGLVLMPLAGYIAARNPHLKPFLVSGSVLLGAAAVLVRAFATNIWVIIVTGLVWTVVSAGLFVCGFVLIRDLFPGAKVGVYLGLVGTMIAIGSLLSPVVTGFVIGALGWRAACHVIYPFLIIGGLLVLFGAKITKAEGSELAYKQGSIDIAGIIAITLFLGPLIAAIGLGSTLVPFGTPLNFAFFGVAIVSLVALVFIIKRKDVAAIVPLPALKDRNTVMLTLSSVCQNFANMFVFYFLPAYIMYIMQPTDFGLDGAAWSGVVMGAFAVVGLFLGPIIGRMIAKSGNARLSVILGVTARLLMMLFLIFFLTPTTSILLLTAVILICGGVTNSVAGTAYTAGINIMAPAKLRQQSNAVVQMAQTFGSSPGIAIGGILIGVFGIGEGLPIAFIVAIVATVVAYIPTLLLRKSDEASKG
jgi:MFS family permease